VVQAASEKLFCGLPFNPHVENHVFAALAVRVGLEIGEGEASMRLAAEAVRSHMRLLTGVVGQLVMTTSPSEPMLAIAAAEALNDSSKTYQQAIKTLLNKLILRGLVLDRGLQGELYSRLLFMLARDKATLPHGGSFVTNDPKSGMPKIQAVRVDLFLQALLGPTLAISTNSTNQQSLCMDLLADMSEVWINFTHFEQLSEPMVGITPSTLLEAWSSCTAFQCHFQQPIIDGFLVAYRGKLDKPFEIKNLFMIPWQTKAKSQAAELGLAQSLTAPFLIKGDSWKKPQHLAILMDLGTTSTFQEVPGARVFMQFEKAEPPKKLWGGYRRKKDEPKRYCLNIRGHSLHEYPVLDGFETQFDQSFQRSITDNTPGFKKYEEIQKRSLQRFKLGG
jgi:hypothetical protein